MTIETRFHRALARVRAILNRRALDDEFSQELETHIALNVDERVRRGMTPEAARRAALLEIGSAASLADQHRAARGLPTLDDLLVDVRYGLRLLRRRPGASAIAMLTIALGLGTTISMFSVAYGVLLKPLPYADENRLVQLREWREGGDAGGRPFLTRPTFEAWSASSSTLQSLAAWTGAMESVVLPDGTSDRVRIVKTSASLFDVLGVRAAKGAVFTAAQEKAGVRGVVLAHSFASRLFGERPDVVGQTLTMSGEPMTVMAIMPEAFSFPDHETVLWAPLSRDLFVLGAVARLAPGSTLQQASDEGTARARTLSDQGRRGMALFGSNGLSHVSATQLRPALTAAVQPIILLVFGGGALLLTIATVNVAGVQLARISSRRQELAIRTSIGASWGRIVRQLFIENLVAIGLAGAAGLPLAAFLNRMLLRFAPAGAARLEDVAIDGSVVLFACGLTLVVGIVCGLLPAMLMSRGSVAHGVFAAGNAPVGARLSKATARARWIMLAGQAAIAAALLTGASLITRSFIAVVTVDRGFTPSGVLTARLPFASRSFTRAQRTAALDAIITQLEHTPGVTHAAATDILPLIDLEFPRAFQLPASVAGGDPVLVKAMSRSVTRDYFATLGMRLETGRVFDATDTLTSRPVAVVNRTFVRRYLAGREAIGTPLPVGFARGEQGWEIVGIVSDVRNQRASDSPQSEVFGCVCQMENGMLSDVPAIAVRTSGDAIAFAPALRNTVRQAAPTASLESVMTMEERLRNSVAGQRLSMTLFAGFAGFAVLIVGLGLFGVLSFVVAQRARELGVRKALGASNTHMVILVARQASIIVVPGLVLGLTIALGVGRYYRSLLFGVTILDPMTLIVVPVILATAALAATLVPALRAVRLDPMRVLKDA